MQAAIPTKRRNITLHSAINPWTIRHMLSGSPPLKTRILITVFRKLRRQIPFYSRWLLSISQSNSSKTLPFHHHLGLRSGFAFSMKNKNPTRYHLLFYWTSYRLNMFRALLFPSSGARDYNVDYHIGRFVLGLPWVGSWLQAGWSSARDAG